MSINDCKQVLIKELKGAVGEKIDEAKEVIVDAAIEMVET